MLSPPVFTFSARQVDPNGPQAFVVGTGGMDRHSFNSIAPNSVTRNDRAYGVLQRMFKDASYDRNSFRSRAGRTRTAAR